MAENIAANEGLVDKMTSFIFDEDFDTSLSFDSWLETRRELATTLVNDHVMKATLDAIPDRDAGYLFMTSVFGLTSLLHVVNVDVNQKNKHGHTPVYLAAASGHSTTVSMLVDQGANVNIKCGRYGSPLHAACFVGHLETVGNLLKLGTSISYGVVFDGALQAAYRGGHEDVALHLITSGSLVKREDDYEKALEGAARAGFVNVIEQLQRPPCIILNNSNPDKVRKKTRKAIKGGQLGVIRQFLDQQINKKVVLPPDAVALATLYNHKNLVEFLLDEGMGAEVEGIIGSPLRTACLLNYQPIVRLLLDRKAEINTCGNFGDALQAAAMKGNTAVVKLIIDEGANVNQQSRFYGTALQAAAYYGQHGSVELLLDGGANVHGKGYSNDAFHAAAEGGHQDVIMLMLQKGYELYRPPPSPLLRTTSASLSPYKALMQDASPGRDAHAYGRRQSPLASKDMSDGSIRPATELEAIFRAAKGESKMAQLRTEKVPATSYVSQSYSKRNFYALEAAASAGHEATVKLLLEKRNVLGISEDVISDAIKVAASNAHHPVVQLLLDDVEKRQSIKSHIESILEVGHQRQQSQIVDFALARAFQHCSADEIADLKQNPVTAADKYHHDRDMSQQTLVKDFADSYKTGNIQVIDAILDSKHHEALSLHEIDAGIQLCIIKNQDIVAQKILESPSLKERLPSSGEEAFIAAAGAGSVNMMKLLTSYWTGELTTSSNAISRALVVSSENGHINVVRYLVQDILADPNNLAYDKPIGPGLSKDYWASSPFTSVSNASLGQSQASQGNATVVPVISPLQAALRGFVRFGYSKHYLLRFPFDSTNAPRKAARPQQEEVINSLLDNGSKPDDLAGQNVYQIQMAARLYPGHIMEKLISVGTDVNATKDGDKCSVRSNRTRAVGSFSGS